MQESCNSARFNDRIDAGELRAQPPRAKVVASSEQIKCADLEPAVIPVAV